jgi:hypothetical protein
MKKKSWLTEGLFTVHGKEIEQVFRSAVLYALSRHKLLGQSVTALHNGQIVIVPPDEIQVDEDSLAGDGQKFEKDEI